MPCPAITRVDEDWEGNVVALVHQDDLEELFQRLKTSWSALSNMTPSPTLLDA